MGGFFSKILRRNPEGYQQLSDNSSKPVIPTIFYQVAIKKGSIQNENNKNEKILKCLQVSDFLSRPKNYKVGIQNGGGFFNFAKSKKKPLFIFCCDNTFEAKMTLHFSWIRMISSKFPILILGSPNKNNKNQNWNTTPNELKKLSYDSPNFSLEKIPLTFVYYTGDNDSNAIMQYYIKRQNIKLTDYDGVKLVFVQDFPDRRECELLDSSQNLVFPGAWVDSAFVTNHIFKKSNPLVDKLFLPDFNELMKEDNFGNLIRLERYLRFLMMHYSGNLGKSKKFKNIKLPLIYFFGYENMREILKQKIINERKRVNNLKKTQQKPI